MDRRRDSEHKAADVGHGVRLHIVAVVSVWTGAQTQMMWRSGMMAACLTGVM
jgi:hypothetical protein